MNDAKTETKLRDREIAENESERQVAGDIRVSTWAIGTAVIVGLIVFGWVFFRH